MTKLAVIEAGCLSRLEAHAAALGLPERRAAVYDQNTYRARGLTRPSARQEIILPAENLCANERAVTEVLQSLKADTETLVAVGAGAIHDIVRYCAHKLSIPFIACPTAASVDGFASGVCTMTWRGVQRKMPAAAPSLVLADVNVLSAAPKRLTAAGLGEALGKFTALTDWRVAGLLTGQRACPAAEAMMLQAAVAALGCCAGFSQSDPGAVAQLIYALLLAGFAAQMMDPSQPASAAEHHMAYLMDLMSGELGVNGPLLHGEKVGVSALVIAELYQRVAQIDDIGPYLKAYRPLEQAWLIRQFGNATGVALAAENTPDSLEKVDMIKLAAQWESIRRIIREMPDAAELKGALQSAGAIAAMDGLGIAESKIPRMLELAPCVRNRLTLLRMLRMLKFRYANTTSRTPSGAKRYTDKAVARAGGKLARGG